MWIIFLFIFSVCNAQERFLLLEDFGGLNTTQDAYQIRINQAVEKVNLITDEGGAKTRKGYTSITSPNTSKEFLKLFNLEMSNGERFMILQAADELWATANPSPTSTSSWVNIKTGISWQQNPLRSAVLDDKIWFTNGIDYVFYWDGDMTALSCATCDFIPKGFDIEAHNNRLYIGGTYVNVSIVYYSEFALSTAKDSLKLDNIDSWPATNFRIFGYRDGDRITTLKSYQGNLYMFKRNRTWRWDIQQPINDYYGCIYKETIQPLENNLVFMSNHGIVVFNGSAFQRVDENIRATADNSITKLGRVLSWEQTSGSDFFAGTSTGITIPGNEITLEDKTKIWRSSATYPTAFSTTTIFGSSSTFVDTIIKGNYIVLQPTFTYSLNYRTKLCSISRIYEDIHWTTTMERIRNYENEWKIYDEDGFNTIATNSDTSTPGADKKKWTGTDKVEYRDIYYEFNIAESTETLHKIRYKMFVQPDMFLMYSDYIPTSSDSLSFKMIITILFVNDEGNRQEIGRKEKQFSFFGSQLTKFSIGEYLLKDIHDETIDDTILLSPFIPSNGQKAYFKISIEIADDDVPDVNNNYFARVEIPSIYQIEFYTCDLEESIVKSTGTYTTEQHSFDTSVYLSTAVIDCADGNLQVGTTALFSIRSSSAVEMGASISSWTAYTDFADGDALPSLLSPCRYIQVRSSFSTTISSHTPVLRSI